VRTPMPSNDPTNPIEDSPASPTPPATSNPLGGAIVPGIVVLVILVGVWFFVIPLFKDVSNTQDKFRSIAKPIPAPTTAPMPRRPWDPPQ
jgi:hypothetical protein